TKLFRSRRIDMRYQGEGYDIGVRLPLGLSSQELLEALPGLFEAAYRDVLHTTLNQPLEITGLKVEAKLANPQIIPFEAGKRDGSEGACKGTRKAYFPLAGGLVDCPIYDRYKLLPGDKVEGPCLIEERESTCLLDKG